MFGQSARRHSEQARLYSAGQKERAQTHRQTFQISPSRRVQLDPFGCEGFLHDMRDRDQGGKVRGVAEVRGCVLLL